MLLTVPCYLAPPPQGDVHPIVPVMLGDARLAVEFAQEMLQKGIYVIGFTYPVVAKGYQWVWFSVWVLMCAFLSRQGSYPGADVCGS